MTQSVVGQVWNNNGAITTTAGTAYLSLSGHATTSTNNITVTAAPGESFRDSFTHTTALAFNSSPGARFVLPSTAGAVNYFNVSDDHVVFDGLQFQDPNATSGSTIIAAAQNFTLQGCIVDGYGQTSGAAILQGGLTGASTCTFNVVNCLVIDRAPSATAACDTFNINYSGAVANSTFVAINAPANLSGLINQATAAGVATNVENCIFVGYVAGNTAGANAAATVNISYSITTAAAFSAAGDVVGSGCIYNATAAALFVSATTDFRIQASSSAVNAGATDTTDVPSATDIVGTSRPQGTAWDIGAYELPATRSVGTAAGTSTATGVGAASARSRGTAAGTSTALGVALGPAFAAGTAAGTSSVVAYPLTASVTATIAIAPVGPAPAALRFAATAFPPAAPTFVQSIIPAYLYQQYADDDDVGAFVTAYNNMAQTYLDWMRNINLPVYTGRQINGALLDWVASGLYGISRPTLSFTQTTGQGAFDTYPLGFLPFDGAGANNATTLYTVTDDIFKRIITWSFYKGDGNVFSVRWLKRRVARFLAGVNGTDYGGPTYQISVAFVGSKTINITISGGAIPTTYAPVFQAALLSGILPMPFQYAYNILLK